MKVFFTQNKSWNDTRVNIVSCNSANLINNIPLKLSFPSKTLYSLPRSSNYFPISLSHFQHPTTRKSQKIANNKINASSSSRNLEKHLKIGEGKAKASARLYKDAKHAYPIIIVGRTGAQNTDLVFDFFILIFLIAGLYWDSLFCAFSS